MVIKFLKILFALPKTRYLNFRLLPFRDSFKLPICVTYNTKIRVMGGKLL